MPLSKEYQKQFSFIWDEQSVHIYELTLWSVTALCHNIGIQRDFDHLDIAQKIMLVWYIDDITLFSPDEQEIVNVPNACFKTYVLQRWEIKL